MSASVRLARPVRPAVAAVAASLLALALSGCGGPASPTTPEPSTPTSTETPAPTPTPVPVNPLEELVTVTATLQTPGGSDHQLTLTSYLPVGWDTEEGHLLRQIVLERGTPSDIGDEEFLYNENVSLGVVAITVAPATGPSTDLAVRVSVGPNVAQSFVDLAVVDGAEPGAILTEATTGYAIVAYPLPETPAPDPSFWHVLHQLWGFSVDSGDATLADCAFVFSPITEEGDIQAYWYRAAEEQVCETGYAD